LIWDFAGIPSIELSGVFWRMLAPRWSFEPLSGAGAARAGGRWNEPGQAALYLSDSHGTAIAEYHQDLPRPGTLTSYAVDAKRLIDLADPAVQSALGLDQSFFRQAWKYDRDIKKVRPLCWDFARQAIAAGLCGLRVPSAQAQGNNLVLWQWNTVDAPSVRVIDPLQDLPTTQASWSHRQP
jgi:RES domain-containing protein